jgi:hypothetical protein
MIPKLHYSFAGTPVTMASFWGAVRLPSLAGFVMAIGLSTVKIFLPIESVLLTLIVGAALGGLFYLGVWLVHARGRLQLQALRADLMELRPKAA